MNFLERYRQETTWHGKAITMEVYHLAKTLQLKKWTVTQTAKFFGVSVSLTSENLLLASLIHTNPNLTKIPSRQDALIKARRLK